MNRVLAPILRLDRRGLLYCFNLADQLRMIPSARVISHLGDGYLYVVLALIIYSQDYQFGSNFVIDGLLAFAIELPLYLILKNSIKRPRPAQQVIGFQSRHQASDKFSLPSGHTAAAFLMATILSYYYPQLFWLFYSLAGLIGLSRVFLGVHYPSDIVAGSLLGTSCALLVLVA